MLSRHEIFAYSCGLCRVILPHLEQMAGELGETVKVVKSNCSKLHLEVTLHQIQATRWLQEEHLRRCGPCKVMLPHLEQKAGELGETVKVVKFNCSKEDKELHSMSLR